MKKFLSMFLILSFLFMLVACNSNDNIVSKDDEWDTINPYFTGKVIEMQEKGCVLEVTDIGNGSLWVGSKVHVHTDIASCPKYSVGDFLKISFDGKVASSFPPQITNVLAISKVEGN